LRQLNPAEHNDFSSHGGSLKVSIPLVVDEHEVTGVTVFAVKSDNKENSFATVQIIASGPLILKEKGGREEKSQITETIAVSGNDSFQIQSPEKYDYPSGKEGDCLAQANILFRKIDRIDGQEVASDSLSVDLYIKRKLINVLKSAWKSINMWLANIASSAAVTSLVAIAAYLFGSDLASLVPHFLTSFILLSAIISVLYSWYVRGRIIRKRLECNNMYQQLKERSS
jgi:hypothetical protein